MALVIIHLNTADFLSSHQFAALVFMLEKECGYVDQPIFPPLWRTEYSKDHHSVQ